MTLGGRSGMRGPVCTLIDSREGLTPHRGVV
jgi:hypothetical protein